MILYQCYRCDKLSEFKNMKIILRDYQSVCKECHPGLLQEIKELSEIEDE